MCESLSRTTTTMQGSMMDLAHSLTLNEEALTQISPEKKSLFIFEWLRFLDNVLLAAQKSDIKDLQGKLVSQLTGLLNDGPGPPTRRLIARCMATLFSVGDTFLLFDTVNHCNDILKNKDDSPTFLTTKLAAVCCLGSMYEKLGRMMGRSYEETVSILVKSLKSSESHSRIEIMNTLEKVCSGMGTAASNVHREIYKASRHCLTDRVMAVRSATAKCLLEMLNHAPFLYTTELESLATLCFRALDGSNYEVRCNVGRLLGTLVAMSQIMGPTANAQNKYSSSSSSNRTTGSSGGSAGTHVLSLEEALGLLMSGFLRGGSGFLRGTGEIIKGSSGVAREVRVGVTHAYVVFAMMLGSNWLEKNLSTFVTHILELVSNPKAASSHVDAVYCRKCTNFILRSVLGRMLGEKAQVSACKEIAAIVQTQINSIDLSLENAKDCNQETLFGQHLIVCALHELSSLILSLGTSASNLFSEPTNNVLDTIIAVLVHPCQAARLSAAWTLRCICVAIPSQITPLIDRCIEGIENMRTSPEAISGYSGALAAVLGGVRLSPLGVPHNKGKVIFNTAEELLRSASQNSRLSLNRTQAGWLLIGSIMTLGVAVVKGLLPRMLLLWRNSFPRSNKELGSEMARGDAFTWQVTLEGRAGALSAIHSFLANCPELVTDDIAKRVLSPIESALAMLTNIQSVLKTYGQHLKAPAAMVRLRLYEVLILLPSHLFESSYTHLLRLLVSEFTLSENPANTTTSLLRSAVHADDSVILGSWLQEIDHRTIEDQLQPNSAAGSGALEHDTCCLYRPSNHNDCGPLPLGVAVIDASVTLFGLVFPRVTNKHRVQMLAHFTDCIKAAKSSRAEALSLNVFAALLAGLKGLTESKATLGQDDVSKLTTTLILGALGTQSAMLRCAAAESLGRMAQVVGDPRTTAELAQNSFDRLKSARDVVTRTGHSLALGCMHRYVGGLGSPQHLNTSVSVLLALAQDTTSPVVQVWALHALYLIADSGGPMFRVYAEPTLNLSLKLLLVVPLSHVDVHQCIGKVLTAIITTIGPELQGNTNSVCSMRSSLLCACSIMADHDDPVVRAEATSCLQQLHLFAPRHVNLSSLVPTLCGFLSSGHLLLRKAAVACLRQLTQTEAKEVCDHALALINGDSSNANDDAIIPETGLPGMLLSMLDSESDSVLISDTHDTVVSLLQVLAADNLQQWLNLFRPVLAVAAATGDSNGTTESGNGRIGGSGGADGQSSDDEDEGDGEEFQTGNKCDTVGLGGSNALKKVQPRWPTRVFAMECVRKLIGFCKAAAPRHFSLQLAKEITSRGSNKTEDALVFHLSDLVRMAFIAATSDCDALRLEGLATLKEIIEAFAGVPEPEFPGHLLLEQYQAQVGAALRPAFAPETPPHVTAAACQVCSAWISSGVAKDLNVLRRVQQLLVCSLHKLQSSEDRTQLHYNESLLTLERLALLKAWAQVYIVAMTGSGPVKDNNNAVVTSRNNNELTADNEEDDEFGDFDSGGESLLALVQPELSGLSKAWLAALKDHALLSLPPEFASQLPHDGGAFYTMDTMDSCRPHYAASWPPLVYAAALWLNATQFKEESPQDRFHLLFGICMEALCSPRMVEPIESVITCLRALFTLLDSEFSRSLLMTDSSLAIELSNVLHRLILTRESSDVHQMVMDVLSQVIRAALEDLENKKKNKLKDLVAANQETPLNLPEVDNLGEGGAEGILTPGKSLVFAVLEVCLCLLVNQLPGLNPGNGKGVIPTIRITPTTHSATDRSLSGALVSRALESLGSAPSLCSPMGAVSILPTVLYLTTGVLKESAKKTHQSSYYATETFLDNVKKQEEEEQVTGEVTGVLHALRAVASHPYSHHPASEQSWRLLLQSTLAKIIDLAKTVDDTNGGNEKLGDVSLMMCIAVFVLHAPPGVASAPGLQYPCINHLRRALISGSIGTKIKCAQTLRTLFGSCEAALITPYVHALAPRLLDLLHNPSSKHPSSSSELHLVLEVISACQALVNLAEPLHRVEMVRMLVPELVDCLLEGPALKEADRESRKLHEAALSSLMKIGCQHPQEFKKVMAESSEMRSRVETAARSGHFQDSSKTTGSIHLQGVGQQRQQASPTIKLKTRFTNFT